MILTDKEAWLVRAALSQGRCVLDACNEHAQAKVLSQALAVMNKAKLHDEEPSIHIEYAANGQRFPVPVKGEKL